MKNVKQFRITQDRFQVDVVDLTVSRVSAAQRAQTPSQMDQTMEKTVSPTCQREMQEASSPPTGKKIPGDMKLKCWEC